MAGIEQPFAFALGASEMAREIRLSNRGVDDTAAPATVIGALTATRGSGWTFTLTDDAGGRFALSGANVVVGLTALDHITTPAPTITIEATDGVRTLTRTFTMDVRQPLPATAADLTFISNRVGFPVVSATAGAGDASGLCHSYHVSPEYAVSGGIRMLFVNFYVDGGGVNFPEKKPGNSKTVDFATVFVGATAYPVTFNGGSQSAVIPDGGFIWSDVVMNGGAELALASRTTYYVRVSESVAVGARRVFNPGSQMTPSRYANWSLGDGVQYGSTPDTAKRLTGTVPAYSNGTVMIAPAMIVGKGWDGSAVYAIVGDSIGNSQADGGPDTSTRGVLGHVGRALDDLASGRRSFANLACPGTKPQDQAEDAAGQWALRLDAIRALPNLPFNTVISRMGQNGVFGGTPGQFPQFGSNQPQNLFGAMRKFWAFLDAQFRAPVFQLPVTPRAQTTVANRYWTDPALQNPSSSDTDAYPGGIRYQFNDWLRAAGTLPDYVTFIDDDVWRDPTYLHAFRKIDGEWTIAADIAVGVGASTPVVFNGAIAPQQGDVFVIEPGVTGKAELRYSYRVTGTGPWNVYFTANTSIAHLAGSVIQPTSSTDGLHPGHGLHMLAMAELVALKVADVLP